jgi:hypothetical protein
VTIGSDTGVNEQRQKDKVDAYGLFGQKFANLTVSVVA